MKVLVRLLAAALVAGSLPAFADEPPRMTAPGPYDDMIKQVQEKLNQLGFDAGAVNGDFGEKTQAALAQFQLANLLPVSGALDDATLKELGVERPAESRNPAVGSSGQEGQAGQAAD